MSAARKLAIAPPVLSLREALKLALDELARVASRCPDCDGNGWQREPYVAFLLTDDPRNGPKRGALARRARVLEVGPEVDPLIRAAGSLKVWCPECGPLRQVVETAGRSL